MTRAISTFAGLLFALCAAHASVAAAQVVVLRIDPEAELLCEEFEAGLGRFGVAPDPGYFAEAQRRRLDPSSDRALIELIPALQAQLVLVPMSADATAAQVDFRDGRSGQSLGQVAVPFSNGALGWAGRRVLEREVEARLNAAPSAEGEGGEGAAPEDEGQPAEDESGESAETGAGEPGLRGAIFLGAGFGMRNLEWPASGELLGVETGAFPAAEFGAGFAFALSSATAIGPEFVYQTAAFAELKETHVAGATDTIGVRAHRFEALLVLALGFGSGDSWQFAPALGYAVRNLRPDVHHLITPAYSLAGPMLRLGLRIPFGDSVALRIAPEAQYVFVGDDLEERGVQGTGLSVGGQAALVVELSQALALELTFREAHALMSSQEGPSVTDVERFATTRLVWMP